MSEEIKETKELEEVAPEVSDEKEKKKETKVSKEKELEKEIESLKEELASAKNDFARAYADTENMKKRLQNEGDAIKKYRAQSFALEILPSLDNMERALSVEASEDAEGYKKGVEMIYNQLVEALKKEGIVEIDALDKPFDPNYHQAIMTEKVEGKEAGLVIEVFQKGYMIKDRLLRAAMVKVSE